MVQRTVNGFRPNPDQYSNLQVCALAPREISVCPSVAYHKKFDHKNASHFNVLQRHCTVFVQLLPLHYTMKLSTITLLAMAMAPIAMSRRIAHHKCNGNINRVCDVTGGQVVGQIIPRVIQILTRYIS
jgi:hypothetical protein